MMTYQQIKELHSNRVHTTNNGTTKRSGVALDQHHEEASDAVTMVETDDEETSYESEEETQIAQAMARAAFAKSASTPMLNLLLKAAFQEEQAEQQIDRIQKRTREAAAMVAAPTPLSRQPPLSTRSFKKARRGGDRGPRSSTRTTSPVRLSASAPSLKTLDHDEKQALLAKKISNGVKPSEKLQSLLSQAGHVYKTYDYTSLTTMGFFIKLSSKQIAMYDTDLVRAVRDQDLHTLKERLTTVQSLHAGNKFGETILHASCRRAAYPIVKFLLTDAAHPVRVCCDYGRTVLHDAAWTCTPDFAVIDLLLDVCPDLLYVCDRRGNTALDYIPKDQYSAWCVYLESSRAIDRLRPTMLS